MTPHLKHGRRLTRRQRHACRSSVPDIAAGRQAGSTAEVAVRLRCARSTVHYWRQLRTPRPPGPEPGATRLVLSPEVQAAARTYRFDHGLALSDITGALQADFPLEHITFHLVKRLAKDEHWPRLRPGPEKRTVKPFEPTKPGFVHTDTVIGPTPQDDVIFTARERTTRWGFAQASPDRTSAAAAGFLAHVAETSPVPMHTVLTDRGSEFMKDFDAAATVMGLEHRRTKPRTPQTNGMVERFNGLLKAGLTPEGIPWRSEADCPTQGDLWRLERDGTPLPDKQGARLQAALTDYLVWTNEIRPNRSLGGVSPAEWVIAHAAELPGARPATACTLTPTQRHRILDRLRGRRYLRRPPPDWAEIVRLSGDR